jgi:CsoR family transcriptional regulator, copper-sensing transcriptional repressor
MNEKQPSGYITRKDQLLKRLRRVRGQIGGLERMVEDERYCIDVLTQISAARAALDKVALELLDDHVTHCMVTGTREDRAEHAEEMMGAVSRLLRSR